MIAKDMTVKVMCGYTDVAETKDPMVCARVLAILAESVKPETPEQRLAAELKERAEEADSRRYDAERRAERMEKAVKELTDKMALLLPAPPPAKDPSTTI